MRLVLLAFVAALMTAPLCAQEDTHEAPVCAAMDAVLPAGLEEWDGKAEIATEFLPAISPHGPRVSLGLGKGYEAKLRRKAEVTFLLVPEKPGGSASHSGLFWFTVETAGDYTVALGSAAWIDVEEDGKALEPSTFGHGPECTTIRKLVTFALKPGVHALQVAGNGADTVRLMVAKAP